MTNSSVRTELLSNPPHLNGDGWLTPFRIGNRDLVVGGGFEMGHQLGIALVALAGAQLARELAGQLGQRAVAAEQPLQPCELAGIGRGGQSPFALEDGERVYRDPHLEAEPRIAAVERGRRLLAQEV